MQTESSNNSRVVASPIGKYKLISFENIHQIDLYNAKEMVYIFQKGNKEGVQDWVVDLSTITFIDSSGLGGLANQGNYLEKNQKKLILLNPHNNLKHLFGSVGFERFFSIITSIGDLPL